MFGITAFAQAPFAALGGNSYAVNLTDSFTSTDVYAGPAAFQGLYFESFSLSDSDSGANFNFRPTVTENFSLDTNERNVSVYPVSLSEALTLTDTAALSYGYFTNISESLTATDNVAGGILFVGAITETMTVTEDLTGGFFYGVTATETATLTEVITTQTNFVPVVAESLTTTDTVPVIATYRPTVSEIITLIDDPIGRGWFKIVDDQNPNWTVIDNTQ